MCRRLAFSLTTAGRTLNRSAAVGSPTAADHPDPRTNTLLVRTSQAYDPGTWADIRLLRVNRARGQAGHKRFEVLSPATRDKQSIGTKATSQSLCNKCRDFLTDVRFEKATILLRTEAVIRPLGPAERMLLEKRCDLGGGYR